jgi:hypothetical protein
VKERFAILPLTGTKVVKVTAASAAVVEAISPVTTPTIDTAEVRLTARLEITLPNLRAMRGVA